MLVFQIRNHTTNEDWKVYCIKKMYHFSNLPGCF
jgi:hypothetical protein